MITGHYLLEAKLGQAHKARGNKGKIQYLTGGMNRLFWETSTFKNRKMTLGRHYHRMTKRCAQKLEPEGIGSSKSQQILSYFWADFEV